MEATAKAVAEQVGLLDLEVFEKNGGDGRLRVSSLVL
jgi:hypothetical protein